MCIRNTNAICERRLIKKACTHEFELHRIVVLEQREDFIYTHITKLNYDV